MPASLIVYATDGSEYYNSSTHNKLIYQSTVQLTGWITVSQGSSYYVNAPWADSTLHTLSVSGLTISNGRIYIQSFFSDLSINSNTVITTDVYRTI